MGATNQRLAADPNFYCDCGPNKKICKRPYRPENYFIDNSPWVSQQPHGQAQKDWEKKGKSSTKNQEFE